MYRKSTLALSALVLSSCGSSRDTPSGSSFRPVDADGNEIVNALTIAADYLMYYGILAIIIGIVIVVFVKMIKLGGTTIISGVGALICAQILNYVGSHILMFSLAALALTVLCVFIYYKAITTGLPWLEELLKKDLDNDGIIGELVRIMPSGGIVVEKTPSEGKPNMQQD